VLLTVCTELKLTGDNETLTDDAVELHNTEPPVTDEPPHAQDG